MVPQIFAGPFSGKLGAALQTVLQRFPETHGALFANIKVVYDDPFNECANAVPTSQAA